MNTLYQQLMSDGIVVVPNKQGNSAVNDLLNKVKAFFESNKLLFDKQKDLDGHYPRIINLHICLPQLLDLFVDSKVALAVQDEFFEGAESSVYTTLYYERGSAQPIHRDTPYFSTKPEYKYLGVWIALEDANHINGCLEVIKGAHKIPELDRERLALQYFDSLDNVPQSSDILWNAYQNEVLQTALNLGLKKEMVEVRAGDIVIWHPQTPHGGSEIRDLSRTRHSLVLHVTPVGVPVYHQDVFFNPNKVVPTKPSWDYLTHKTRKYVAHTSIEIGHGYPVDASAFQVV